jgi:hypothetical protein
VKLDRPSTRVTYELEEHDRAVLPRLIAEAVARRRATSAVPREASHAAR